MKKYIHIYAKKTQTEIQISETMKKMQADKMSEKKKEQKNVERYKTRYNEIKRQIDTKYEKERGRREGGR